MLSKKSGPEEPKQKKLFPLFDYLCVRFSYMVPTVHARLPARQIKVAFLLALEVELEMCSIFFLSEPIRLFG